jgi:hypothetical protein
MSVGIPSLYSLFILVILICAMLLRRNIKRRTKWGNILISATFFDFYFGFIGYKHSILSRFALYFGPMMALLLVPFIIIMPGLVAHDFGDAIRFAANRAAEDETELTKVYLDFDYFREFTHGFAEAIGGSMTEAEIKTLALGAPTITFELASRFLADHIDGDRYFAFLLQISRDTPRKSPFFQVQTDGGGGSLYRSGN